MLAKDRDYKKEMPGALLPLPFKEPLVLVVFAGFSQKVFSQFEHWGANNRVLAGLAAWGGGYKKLLSSWIIF